MLFEDRRILAVVGFAAIFWGSSRALAQPAPSLGSAASFAVLGGSAVNSTGSTIVTGNLGVSPGNTITGIPPEAVKLGDTFRNEALAKAAQHDANVAYAQLGNGACTPLLSLSGSPPPGIYCVSSPAQLTGPLTLDAAGNHDAVWIFRITDTFTMSPGSCVLAINGTQPGNVFWQVGTSALLRTSSAFVGNLLAVTNITLNSGATASGRLLALTGAVTLNANNASLCSACNAINLDPPSLPDGPVSVHYDQTINASGGTGPYTFKRISGSLPPGLILAPDGALSGAPSQCGKFTFTVAATDSQGCSGERDYTIVIASPNLTLSPATLLPATACVHYEQSVRASGGSGSYSYAFTGLPDGLTPNFPQPGDISGLATTPGPYNVTVTATDTVTGCVVSHVYPLTVLCNVTVLPVRLPAATACALYRTTFTASCGTAPYTFSLAPGTLPAGFVFSPAGKLCVTPTTPGNFTFTVTATDAQGWTGSRTYTVAVGPGPIKISPPTMPNGIVCTPYPSQTITASCGTAPYTCRVTAGTLPPGLTFANCTISGTPTTPGCFTFSVTVTDANGNSNSIRYTICVTSLPPISLPDASMCVFYSQQLTASCGTAPYTFSVSSGTLPGGLMLSQGGLLSGIPTTTGSFIFTVTVTDSLLNAVNQRYTLQVTGGITLSPATLPSASLNVPYNETITASGGTPPYTFAVTSGSIPPPPGLTFNPATGVISGTPTALGAFNFCITATDSSGIPTCTATQCYTLVVAAGGSTLSGWGGTIFLVVLLVTGMLMIRRGVA